ncbi:MAG: peptide-methionine (S)-S-oxide reductase MsrA [Phycisphaerales bacterium]|nr:peptide-methionine (S)-S-oxide reductase MsrA [Phycisphaerales bacterium]
MEQAHDVNQTQDTAIFGEGCFWCTEAFFQRLKGVISVTAGYGGGSLPNPTYDEVCSHKTGHIELAEIIYNPKIISYQTLLRVFFETHDPTSLDKQEYDEGPQYKSVIYYHNAQQEKIATFYKDKLDKSGAYDKPIVTVILPFKNFYPAEAEHQNFYNNHRFDVPYCQKIIQPKIDKFEKVFSTELK